jgi:hypothetical protein
MKNIILLIVLCLLFACSKSKEQVARDVVDSLYRIDNSDELELQLHNWNNYLKDEIGSLEAKEKLYVLEKAQKAHYDRIQNMKRKIDRIRKTEQ